MERLGQLLRGVMALYILQLSRLSPLCSPASASHSHPVPSVTVTNPSSARITLNTTQASKEKLTLGHSVRASLELGPKALILMSLRAVCFPGL